MQSILFLLSPLLNRRSNLVTVKIKTPKGQMFDVISSLVRALWRSAYCTLPWHSCCFRLQPLPFVNRRRGGVGRGCHTIIDSRTRPQPCLQWRRCSVFLYEWALCSADLIARDRGGHIHTLQ